jgi:hypothetical protein
MTSISQITGGVDANMERANVGGYRGVAIGHLSYRFGKSPR